MRRIIFIIFLLMKIMSILIAEEYFSANFERIEINADTIIYDYTITDGTLIVGDGQIVSSYEMKNDSGLTFLHLLKNNQKWLMLRSRELLILYRTNEEKPFFIGLNTQNSRKIELFGFNHEYIINASSHLIEGERQYSARNLTNFELNSPWVEGVEGVGLNELLQLEERYSVGSLVICNGFISFDNPGLYRKNSRVKSLEIIDKATNERTTIELEDTPNPQYFDLGSVKQRELVFVIKEVYYGEVWEDTCISTIILGKVPLLIDLEEVNLK